MNRKDFIKKGLMGTGMFITSAAVGDALKNDIDEIPPLEPIGFNHLPNPGSLVLENTVLHKAATRGHANHGWLDSHHTFSFANYHNPDRMHFGVLRVLNDDRVDPGMGFGTHPHDNMEIISIPLEGDLEHKDSMDNTAVIRKGDIQVMSAGTGIYHSEYNKNKDKLTKFLQIWVYPNKRNVTPRYGQVTLDEAARRNNLQQVLSPSPDDEGVWIHQDAWFHLGTFDTGKAVSYSLKKKGNGIYAFVIKGDFTIGSIALNQRDGVGIWDTDEITITANSQDAEILLMEVPMALR
ncbi:pirin family protein [Flavobacterium sp. MFBS3-15]|uniref:pirin family protein n=1 Tax=Flavobacterium sp. MFBS3-15 TaxID=2989816 RepID=UPI002235B3FB|nr:pirin family protein [Flavobacterium sp. MFBS3-15]MCW4468842.1 pirin family protein [Flavobacterium sp. MFBS3-15]